MFRSTRSVGFLVILAAAGVACAAPTDEEDDASSEAAVTELKAYWADAKRLDLSDLSRVAVGFASDELNDQLTVGSSGIRIDAPAVFAASAEPNRVLPDNTEIKALDTVVSGLASRFGESELGTEVNKARLAHLQSSSDSFYVESGFSARAGLNHGWSFAADGLLDGAGANIGFDVGADGDRSSRRASSSPPRTTRSAPSSARRCRPPRRCAASCTRARSRTCAR